MKYSLLKHNIIRKVLAAFNNLQRNNLHSVFTFEIISFLLLLICFKKVKWEDGCGFLGCKSNNINMEDKEVRAWFPCPFCYVEIEVPILCLHLQEEHYFDMKNAVCPICAANLEKDTISHFTMQHAHSVKRRKKSQNSGFWSCNVSPILTPFLCTVPKHIHKDIYTSSSMAATTDAESSTTTGRDEVVGQNCEERRNGAAFIQELLISTIFFDL
ncbi:hypothetical protein ACJIZ3_020917 [Penstemon smallii]|uniref:Di19 zinc-binding domain-containing protein n=1 Tax=Penstemon smallii TaxID=265156 RepID=A0ABD3SK86_9LAMI